MDNRNEQLDEVRTANLADYFINNGYECEIARNELHVRGYGGLYVNIHDNSWFCFSENKGGNNAVNCLTDVIGLDFKTAVKELAGSLTSPSHNSFSVLKNSEAVHKELVLPERAENMRKVFAYLCKTRGISSDIVSQLAHDKLLYQDVKGNAVFIHKSDSGEIVGAEIQGTNSEKRYKGVAQGTHNSVFAVSIGEPKKCYVFESAIDLLSFKQIANQDKIRDSVLISMAGLKPDALKKFSERGLKIYSCVDNDEAGIKFETANNLPSCRKVLIDNGVKDYNELLKKLSCPQEILKNPVQNNHSEKSEFEKVPTKKSAHVRR